MSYFSSTRSLLQTKKLTYCVTYSKETNSSLFLFLFCFVLSVFFFSLSFQFSFRLIRSFLLIVSLIFPASIDAISCCNDCYFPNYLILTFLLGTYALIIRYTTSFDLFWILFLSLWLYLSSSPFISLFIFLHTIFVFLFSYLLFIQCFNSFICVDPCLSFF